MGLLKHFRSKSRLKDPEAASPSQYTSSYPLPQRPAAVARYGRDFTTKLPDKALTRILQFVCPHSTDCTYEPSEQSQIGDGCMLCDLRDLSNCASVCRKWYGLAQKLLYKSIRIDAVHYCELEDELAERRKKNHKKGKFGKSSNGVVEPSDVPNIRLQLLARTVRLSPQLAGVVQVLKLPYMTRETAKGDLARTVAALPNLRYVDLPDGFFTGDPSCLALRQELQARCPDIRKMSYHSGSEDALELLAQRHWQSIEILELSGLAVEPATLRIVLASLPTLHELTMSEMEWLDDEVFTSSPGQLPDFPALQAFKLMNLPHLTAKGLKSYLESPATRAALQSLTLERTGVTVSELPPILWAAGSLVHLSITETVSKSLGLAAKDLAPLTSISLKTLHYEITSHEDVHGLQKPAESYYSYLATSLHQNALPALETLYVRDPSFADLLLIPEAMPPLPPLPRAQSAMAGNNSDFGSLRSKQSNLSVTPSSNSGSGKLLPSMNGSRLTPSPTPGAVSGGFNQTLEIFSKGIDELEWVVTAISPPSPAASRRRQGSNASASRPLSAYTAAQGLGPQWARGGFGGEARKSVIVGNGFGGFLAIPQEEAPRPRSADGRWGSVSSTGSKEMNGGGWMRPPTVFADAERRDKRHSRRDMWR